MQSVARDIVIMEYFGETQSNSIIDINYVANKMKYKIMVKIIAISPYHLTSDKKSLSTRNHTLFYFLNAIWCPEYRNLLQIILDYSSHHCCQGFVVVVVCICLGQPSSSLLGGPCRRSTLLSFIYLFSSSASSFFFCFFFLPSRGNLTFLAGEINCPF